MRLMCVLAHPDDESLGTGGTLAKYAAEGVETYLVTATRGERGRFGDGGERPAPEVVGRTREAELRAAAKELGVREVDRPRVSRRWARCSRSPRRRTEAIAGTSASHPAAGGDHVRPRRRVRPSRSHRHLAVHDGRRRARAADRDYAVSKLYYIAWSASDMGARTRRRCKKLTSTVDGVERQVGPGAGLGDHHADRHERGVADRVARGAVPSHADEHLQEPRRSCRRNTIARCGACRSSTARSAW